MAGLGGGEGGVADADVGVGEDHRLEQGGWAVAVPVEVEADEDGGDALAVGELGLGDEPWVVPGALDFVPAPVGAGMVVVSAVEGSAGIGKTTLALYWARKHNDRFPDGQLYVNLAGFDPTSEPSPLVPPHPAMNPELLKSHPAVVENHDLPEPPLNWNAAVVGPSTCSTAASRLRPSPV